MPLQIFYNEENPGILTPALIYATLALRWFFFLSLKQKERQGTTFLGCPAVLFMGLFL